MRRPSLYWLLILAPVSLVAQLAFQQDLMVFLTAAGAIIPLAGLIGRGTEQLALHAGPRVGGLLNATFGNVTELIIAIFLITRGEIDVVKASLTGSILGNLLLVLGVSFLVGGIKHREQGFNALAASVHSTSMVLAVIGLFMPALFVLTTGRHDFVEREVVSGTVAAILMCLYAAALVFTMVTHEHLFRVPTAEDEAKWSVRAAVLLLLAATALVAVESELLALKNKLDVTLEIAIGSSTQIALFVAPALVFISLAAGNAMDFVFTTFEVAAVGLSTLIVAFISLDGRTNWLEGAQLLGAYAIMGVSFFFVRTV